MVLVRRLDSVQVVLQGGLEDPLDKEEELQDQMDSLPYLCRFQYENTCTYVCGLLDPTIEAFSQCERPPPPGLQPNPLVHNQISEIARCLRSCCAHRRKVMLL